MKILHRSIGLSRCSVAPFVAALVPLLCAACGSDDGGSTGSKGAGAAGGTGGSSGSGGLTAGGAGGGGGSAGGAAGSGGTAGGSGGTAGTGGSSCHATAPADHAVLQFVVSHPYDDMGAQAPVYELVEVDGTTLTRGTTFDLGRNFLGEITFTPDGQIGFVAEDDGKLGVFRLTPSGVEVVHAAYEGSFYASGLVMAPDGATLYIQDGNWRENGGGLYAVDIGCDGSLSNERKLVDAKLPYGFAFAPNDPNTAYAFARDLGDSPMGEDFHVLAWGSAPMRSGGTTLFNDEEAQVSTLVVTHDGKFALMGDNAGFSSVPNRVGVAKLGASPSMAQVLSPIEDPIDIVTSPFDDAAVVISGFGEKLWILDYDATAAQPFSVRGEVAYSSPPELPAYAVSIDQGQHKGRVFIAENGGIRMLRFAADGQVSDEGVLDFGDGLTNAIGSIGVVP
ncbi:MAG: hypothetical protein AB7K71_22615 [Polyangiaceae bacterium]